VNFFFNAYLLAGRESIPWQPAMKGEEQVAIGFGNKIQIKVLDEQLMHLKQNEQCHQNRAIAKQAKLEHATLPSSEKKKILINLNANGVPVVPSRTNGM
jgi:hypothetical protein